MKPRDTEVGYGGLQSFLETFDGIPSFWITCLSNERRHEVFRDLRDAQNLLLDFPLGYVQIYKLTTSSY